MKLKKILSICLVGAMAATLLAGCGSSDETVGEEIKEDAETVVDDVKDVAEEAAEDVKDVAEDVGEGVKDAVEDVGEDVKDAAEEAVEDVKDNANGGVSFEGFEDLVTIKAYGMTLYGTDGSAEVIDAINEISVPAINVKLDYTPMDLGSYSEQLGLMFSSGESFDLMMIAPVNSATFSVLLSKNELMDISDYLYEYAPDMMEFMAPYMGAFEYDGGVYGVPGYKLFTGEDYLIMRKDILDYLDLTEQAEAISSWSDLEDLFEIIYAAQDSLPEELQTPAMINNAGVFGQILPFENVDVSADDFSEHYGFDSLGDSYQLIFTDDDGNVQNYFAREEYLEVLNRVREWYEKGWVYKDAATSPDNGDLALMNGVSFCVIEGSQLGVEEEKKKATGYDVVCVNVCDIPIQTSNISFFGWAVPVTANEPEAAVAFMNLMFTNAEIENLLVYGIEGRDYDLNEEGEAVVREDAVYQSGDYLYGNQFLAYPAEGQGSDFRDITLAAVMEGELSPYYGITINTEEIEPEISAVYAVVQKYAPALQSGTVDASETYDEFLEELDAAGMPIIVDFYQEKLDEWLAEQ